MKDNKSDQEIRIGIRIQEMRQEFLTAMTFHNKHDKIRKMELKQKEKRSQLHAQEAFNKNRHQYAKKFLDPKAVQGKPGFSKEVANGYFHTTHEDKKRDYQYNPLRGIPKPAARGNSYLKIYHP